MDYVSSFLQSFIRRILWFTLSVAVLVVGVPSVIVFSQHQPFSGTDLFSSSSGNPTSSAGSTSSITLKPQQNPLPATGSSSHMISLGWLVGNDQQVTSFNDLQMVSPLFATIDSSYHVIQQQSTPSITNLQHAGKQVWGRVTLTTQSDASTHLFLQDSSGMKQAIDSLVTAAAKANIDGLNIDIEQVSVSDLSTFGQFIKDLSVPMKQKNINLSIDIQPEPQNASPSYVSFNKLIGTYCDEVVFMGYDLHWSTDSTPGPVTSLHWLDDNIKQFTQTGIPSQKLILGLPSYSRIWEVDQNGATINSLALSNEYVSNLMRQDHHQLTWQPSDATYYTTYQRNGNTYKVWLTNNRSLQDYFNLATKYDLGGIGFWNLNFMSPNNWNQLIKAFNSNHKEKI